MIFIWMVVNMIYTTMIFCYEGLIKKVSIAKKDNNIVFVTVLDKRAPN